MGSKAAASYKVRLADENEVTKGLKGLKGQNEVGEGGYEIENESGGQSNAPAPKTHIYSQVCPECHHAWVEKRVGDVGKHRTVRIGESKDEDCLLWNVISQGPGDTEVEDVSAAAEGMNLRTEASTSDVMSSNNGELGAKVEERINREAGSERENKESNENTQDGSAATAEELYDDADEVVPPAHPERETYDFNGVLFYTSSDEPKDIGQAIRIIPESKIHMPLVQSWLRTCEDGHPECNKPRFARTADPRAKFHLIDIYSQQIVPGTLSSPFVALSYVWGGAEQLQLTQVLYPELTQHQGLVKYEDSISTAIKDAMTVVSGLGERYLWVDCLCIIQDNTSDKQTQIDQMAAIYDAAMLTIVACTASNANDFLPGVQSGKRFIEDQVTRQNGILFANEKHSMLAWTLPRVSHSKRAWTFQEVILSRRCLYFLDGEVMMQCQKSLFKESTPTVSNHQALNQTGNWPPLTKNFVSEFFRYRELVHTYSSRKLTFPKDRKDAFTGVTKALELTWGWKVCYCMPASDDFNWALLWTGEYSTNLGKQWKEKQWEMARTSGFPTWSWLSAAGRAWYLNEKESAGNLQPLIDWNNTTVWDGLRTYNFLKDPLQSSGIEAHVEGYPPGTLIIMGWVKHLSYATQFGAKLSSAVKEEMEKQAGYGAPCAPLVDGKGNWCGTLNGLTEEQMLQLLIEDGAELSLVLLSAIQKSWVLGGFRKSPPPFDVESFENGEFKTVNVMLVKWKERLATRVAVGEMHIDAWNDKYSEPEGDLIRLI